MEESKRLTQRMKRIIPACRERRKDIRKGRNLGLQIELEESVKAEVLAKLHRREQALKLVSTKKIVKPWSAWEAAAQPPPRPSKQIPSRWPTSGWGRPRKQD
jgi:hypothetical protein